MSLDLFVNGKRLEVSKNTPIALTYVANDLAELRNRQSNRSNRFKIPLTRLNREILELPDIITSETLIPYRSNDAIVIQDGVQIVPEGLFEILQVQDMIDAQVISGNNGFFDKIKDKDLRDLDLSAFNHTWDLSTVIASRNNIAANGYIYPLINYGNLTSGSNTFDVRLQPASVFYKTILDQIHVDAGYSKTGDIFTKSVNVGGLFGTNVVMYPNMIIPFSNDALPNAFGTTVNVSDLLPDMTQTDFVKAFMQLFGLFPQADQVAKNVDYFQLQEVINNQDQVVNWSDKMDTSRKPTIKYGAGSYGQVNRLRYSQDDSDINFGAGTLNIDDETIVGERVLFNVPFSSTKDAPALQTARIPLINKIVDGVFSTTTNPRILIMRRGSQVGQIAQIANGVDYTDGFATTNIAGNDLPYCHFDRGGDPIVSMSFGNNPGRTDGLISAHYDPAFSSMFTRPKELTQNFKLDQVDISSIDHSLPVFIESMNEFFYLNRVDKYIGGRLTPVNLIRL